MLDVFALEGLTMLVVEIGLLAVKLYAFISSLRFSDDAYRAAGKLNKAAWTIILGLGRGGADRARRVTSQSDQSGHDRRGAGLPC